MVSAVSELRTNGIFQLSGIPIGVTAQLIVSMHNDLGERFYATNSKISFRTNRLFKIISVRIAKNHF